MTGFAALEPDISRRDAMARLVGAFASAGIEDAGSDARLLLCAAAGLDHAALIRDPEAPLDDEARATLAVFAGRRLAREPVTRILGERGFWSLDLVVGPDVLDPRPDSETLIDAALRVFAERQDAPLKIADLGSGSGALLCALLDVFPNASGLGVDVSGAARALTARNLAHCGLAHRGKAVQADWSSLDAGGFDLIVSNPPYIASADIERLDREVRDHDPRLALDGGPDGFDAYRSLARVLPRLLARDGVAIVEIGAGQGPTAIDILEAGGLWFLGGQRDLAGIERALAFLGEKLSNSTQ